MDPLTTLEMWINAARDNDNAASADAAHNYNEWVNRGGWAVRVQRTTRGPVYTVRRVDAVAAFIAPLEHPCAVERVVMTDIAAALGVDA